MFNLDQVLSANILPGNSLQRHSVTLTKVYYDRTQKHARSIEKVFL